VVPAAGRGRRFGGETPKQYLQAAGRPVIAHAFDALLADARVAGIVVAIGEADAHWPGWTERGGRPVHACPGGAERADSVRAALQRVIAIDGPDALALVHDAARPNLHPGDLSRLLDAALGAGQGAILATPVRDTLKRTPDGRSIEATVAREGLWRALTPQAFRAGSLRDALDHCRAHGIVPTDEAMAMESVGARPLLVEGRDDNLKVTTPADLALVEFLLARREGAA
jgi:2-C-methyl-D-erythritol 4-phosphate cytidylyltransferase